MGVATRRLHALLYAPGEIATDERTCLIGMFRHGREALSRLGSRASIPSSILLCELRLAGEEGFLKSNGPSWRFSVSLGTGEMAKYESCRQWQSMKEN
jgi:hypothetical protein